MHRLFQALRPFIRAVVRRAGWVLVIALLLSAGGFSLALNLRIDTDFANLIPQEYPSVQALEKLRATVGSATTVDVAIQSPSFAANKAFAEALIPQAMAMQNGAADEPYFSRYEYTRETEFLKDNALYFATWAELDSLETYLNTRIEDAKLEANPFFFDLDDEEEEEEDAGEGLLASYNDIVGSEYMVSPDSTVLVVQFFPTGSQTNLGFIEDLYARLETTTAALNPAGYHADMQITLSGRLYRQLTEIRAIQNDVLDSFGAGVGAVLLFVVLYFFYKAVRARAGGGLTGRVVLTQLLRTPLLALVIGLPLLMSLAWTFGVAYLAYEDLNLMTATLGLVLFGLGIDYGIHFYARYTEERARGRSIIDAAEETFASTGQAITVGALTTAAALYVLMFADFKGFSEFGFIAGNGILFALIAMIVVMPALLAVFEKWRLLNFEAGESAEVQQKSPRRFPLARGLVAASLALVVAALVFVPRIRFEYEFGKLEPDYPAWDARNAVVQQVFNTQNRRNPAYIVLDTPDEVPAVVDALRATMEAEPDSTQMIEYVESLQDRFPTTPEGQQQKLDRIADIRAILADPFLEAEESEELDKLRRAAQTSAAIDQAEVPDYLKRRFTSKDGEIGSFIIIYPDPDRTLSDVRNSIAFSEEVGTVTTADGTVYHAGSTSLIGADMIRLLQREAPWMIIATFIMVMLLMGLNFGSVRWAALAVLPLVVGVLWMLLAMELGDFKLNFYNLVVLPAILGIGNDAGAHLVHRYREEGPGSIWRVLRSTGEHVTMGALTTMLGFGGLLLSFHPGLESMGLLAVVGIATTLLAALLFLPALLQWLEGDAPTSRPSEKEEG